MDFSEIDFKGVPRIRPEQVIRGDVCRYLEVCDDGTVHTSKDLVAHRKDQSDWWDRRMTPITDQDSGRVATYLVRPRWQDPPTAPPGVRPGRGRHPLHRRGQRLAAGRV